MIQIGDTGFTKIGVEMKYLKAAVGTHKSFTRNIGTLVLMITLLPACGESSNPSSSKYGQKTFKKPSKIALTAGLKTGSTRTKLAMAKNRTSSSKDGVFETVDIREIIEDVAVWTDKNVTIDRRLTGNIRIALPKNATATESYTAFRYAIKLKGWAIVETEKVITITSAVKKAQKSSVPKKSTKKT